MKILVLSNTPWSNENSFGNSYNNIFEGFKDAQFANIYCSFGNPSSQFVKKFFQITEKFLIRNLKDSKYPSGKIIACQQDSEQLPPAFFTAGQKRRWMVMFWARDFIWKVGRWKSKELRQFIDDFNPDLIFQPIYYSNYISDIALYIKKYTNVPMVGYVSDDVYTLKQFSLSPLYWIDRFFKRRKIRKVIQKCEHLYVISNIQKTTYEKQLKVPCSVLTKISDFAEAPKLKQGANNPIKLVYTGNIGTNRWKSLSVIAKALKEINMKEIRATLEIYTATPVTKKMDKALNISGCSSIMGTVPSREVPEIQKNADILVHVEGLDLKSRLAVRMSFSTKIVDYFKMARPILAVGPKDVASIRHLEENDCAITATCEDEVIEKLRAVLDCPEKLNEIALRGYECGRTHHNRAEVVEMLESDLNRLVIRA